MKTWASFTVLVTALAAPLYPTRAEAAKARAVSVCVAVELKDWRSDGSRPTPKGPPAGLAAPVTPPAVAGAAAAPPAASPASVMLTEEPAAAPEIPPAMVKAPEPLAPAAPPILPDLYLKRLLEYEVTHDVGYEAVPKDCQERLTVELYEVDGGWTVFGRFSRFAREEKVDRVTLDEFAALAERVAAALLHDVPITDTVTRQNVLRADSETAMRSIRGRSHFLFGLGTSVRVGELPTATDSMAPAKDEIRVLTPLAFSVGYRGKFRTWGLDAFGRLLFGTSERALQNNDGGGHADFTGGGGLGLHFLRYADASGMNSIYFGGGASFELLRFETVRPKNDRTEVTRDALWNGGLNADLVLGYEFMRASAVHFYTELSVGLPLYALANENHSGSIDTYMPGALAQVGALF